MAKASSKERSISAGADEDFAFPLMVTVQENPSGGYEFVYSGSIVNNSEPVAQLMVPSGQQVLTFSLVSAIAGAAAVFVEHPVIWVNDVPKVEPTPPGMAVELQSDTELTITVDNQNSGPGQISHPFFLVVALITGPGPGGVTIVGRDPILIEDPPGG